MLHLSKVHSLYEASSSFINPPRPLHTLYVHLNCLTHVYARTHVPCKAMVSSTDVGHALLIGVFSTLFSSTSAWAAYYYDDYSYSYYGNDGSSNSTYWLVGGILICFCGVCAKCLENAAPNGAVPDVDPDAANPYIAPANPYISTQSVPPVRRTSIVMHQPPDAAPHYGYGGSSTGGGIAVNIGGGAEVLPDYNSALTMKAASTTEI